MKKTQNPTGGDVAKVGVGAALIGAIGFGAYYLVKKASDSIPDWTPPDWTPPWDRGSQSSNLKIEFDGFATRETKLALGASFSTVATFDYKGIAQVLQCEYQFHQDRSFNADVISMGTRTFDVGASEDKQSYTIHASFTVPVNALDEDYKVKIILHGTDINEPDLTTQLIDVQISSAPWDPLDDKILRVDLDPIAGGYATSSISSNEGISIWYNGTQGSFGNSSIVRMTAHPLPGYSFKNWSGELTDTSNISQDVNLSEDRVITAHFENAASASSVSIEGLQLTSLPDYAGVLESFFVSFNVRNINAYSIKTNVRVVCWGPSHTEIRSDTGTISANGVQSFRLPSPTSPEGFMEFRADVAGRYDISVTVTDQNTGQELATVGTFTILTEKDWNPFKRMLTVYVDTAMGYSIAGATITGNKGYLGQTDSTGLWRGEIDSDVTSISVTASGCETANVPLGDDGGDVVKYVSLWCDDCW